jgi:hypothetical protein
VTDTVRNVQLLRELFPLIPERILTEIRDFYCSRDNLVASFKREGTLKKMLDDAQQLFDDGKISDCRMAIDIIMDLIGMASSLTNEQLARAHFLLGRVKEWGTLEEKATAIDEFLIASQLDPSLKLCSDDILHSVLETLKGWEADLPDQPNRLLAKKT